MEMTEVFDRLKELQSILAEKYSLKAKIEDAPKQLSSQDELLIRLKKEFVEKSDSYDQVKAEIGELQLSLDEAEKSREAGEKGMDNISTHREYEALEKQINEATAREAEIRKTLQKKEKVLEELNETLRMDEQMINAQEEELSNNRKSLDAQIAGYNDQLKELEQKESAVTPGLDAEIVYKFQRIIQRNSEGIVAVKNGVCTGCHMILPAQFANEVHAGEKILFCPYCSRILFHQDILEGEEVEDFHSMDETGSLADFEEDFADELEDEYEEGSEEESSDDDEKSISFDD